MSDCSLCSMQISACWPLNERSEAFCMLIACGSVDKLTDFSCSRGLKRGFAPASIVVPRAAN